MMPDKNELVERLYRLHFKKLFIYANAVLRDPEQAKDVVQDTFHEALRRIDVFAKHENPGGWLMNTLKNKLKENERTRRRDLLRLLSLDADFPDESNLPEELVAAQPEPQEESVIEKVERVLTPEEYQLLKRLVFDRASHLEVAQEFGIITQEFKAFPYQYFMLSPHKMLTAYTEKHKKRRNSPQFEGSFEHLLKNIRSSKSGKAAGGELRHHHIVLSAGRSCQDFFAL